MIGQGKTEGVFQLESAGMKSFMKELKPTNLEDVIAGISLYRPSPMDFIPKYIKGKQNQDSIQYTCPELEEILAPTYNLHNLFLINDTSVSRCQYFFQFRTGILY